MTADTAPLHAALPPDLSDAGMIRALYGLVIEQHHMIADLRAELAALAAHRDEHDGRLEALEGLLLGARRWGSGAVWALTLVVGIGVGILAARDQIAVALEWLGWAMRSQP